MRSNFSIILTMVLAAVFTTMAFGQNPIPNPGFENWTNDFPDDWATDNIPGFYVPVTRSASSHSGSYAAKGEVIQAAEGPITPILFSYNQQFAISQNYTRMTGYYQMTNKGDDALFVEVVFYDAQSVPVAIGTAELGATGGGYQMFTVPMDYEFGSKQPVVTAYIYILITLDSTATAEDVTVGSNFLLDDLAFDMVSSLDNAVTSGTPLVFALGQNYPNPFNPTTNISFSLPTAGNAVLTIYNSLGQVVKTLLNEDLAAGVHQVNFDAAQLTKWYLLL